MSGLVPHLSGPHLLIMQWGMERRAQKTLSLEPKSGSAVRWLVLPSPCGEEIEADSHVAQAHGGAGDGKPVLGCVKCAVQEGAYGEDEAEMALLSKEQGLLDERSLLLPPLSGGHQRLPAELSPGSAWPGSQPRGCSPTLPGPHSLALCSQLLRLGCINDLSPSLAGLIVLLY